MKHEKIQRIEMQSWRSFWLSLIFLLAWMLLMLLVMLLTFVPISGLISVPIPVLLPILTSVLAIGLYFVLLRSLTRMLLVDRLKESSNRQINAEQGRNPNQYSHRSGWYILGSMLRLWLVPMLLLGLAVGPFLGPFFGLFFVFFALTSGLTSWLTYRRLRVLAHKLDRDLSNGQVNTEQGRKPNQTILRSGRYALSSMLVYGLIGWLLFTGVFPALGFCLNYGLVPGLTLWLSQGLIGGLTSGLPYALAFGLMGGLATGRAYLQHYMLRFLLWCTGTMPWQYVRFLDSAAEHILLRKVGGGYIFVHRLLLEYFASLDTTAMHDDAKAKGNR